MLGALSVAGIALATLYGWFLAARLAAGVASAGLFYPPAFAALTGWYGPRRVQALTALSLAAGFASTIFAPLAGPLGWRGTYLVLAAVLDAVTIPAHALGLGGAGQVAGRLCYRVLPSRLGARGRVARQVRRRRSAGVPAA